MLDRSISLHLPPPVPYQTPVATAFIDVRVFELEPSVQLRFLLENGTEPCLPIKLNALERLCNELQGHPDSHDAIP
jgi:hypothetical protein